MTLRVPARLLAETWRKPACHSQTTLGLAAAALAALAVPASAQALPDWSNGWSGQATIYAWIPAINGAQEGRDGEPLVDLDQTNVL